MGWFPFGFLTPSPQKRITRARWLMDHDLYNDARLELEGVEHPDAAPLLAAALDALIELNLMEWLAQRGAGNGEEARAALSRARSFGASAERIAGFVPRGGAYTAAHKLPRRT